MKFNAESNFKIPDEDPLKKLMKDLGEVDEPTEVVEKFAHFTQTIYSLFLSYMCAMERSGMGDFSRQFNDMLDDAHKNMKAAGKTGHASQVAASGVKDFRIMRTQTVPALISGIGTKAAKTPDALPMAVMGLVDMKKLVRTLTLQAMIVVPRVELLKLADDVPEDLKRTVLASLETLVIGNPTAVLGHHEQVIAATIRATMMEHVRTLKARMA